MPPPLRLFPRIVFEILGRFWFQIHFRNDFSRSLRYVDGIWIGIALYLYNNLGSMAIFIMLVLPIQEQGISFHFLKSSRISFFRVL